MYSREARPQGLPNPTIDSRAISAHDSQRAVVSLFQAEVSFATRNRSEGEARSMIYLPQISVSVGTLVVPDALAEFDRAVSTRYHFQDAQRNRLTAMREAVLKQVGGFSFNDEGLARTDALTYEVNGRSVVATPSPRVPGLWVCQIVEADEKSQGNKKGVVYENATILDPKKTPQDYS